MKDTKFKWLFMGIVAGIILSTMIFYVADFGSGSQCCTGLCSSGLPPVNKISKAAGLDAIRCYRKNPIQINALHGFVVNLEQLHAMNKLFSEGQKIKGFRLYYGIIGDPVDVTIVSSINESADVASEDYVTFRRDSGPCPDLCDQKVEEDVGRK